MTSDKIHSSSESGLIELADPFSETILPVNLLTISLFDAFTGSESMELGQIWGDVFYKSLEKKLKLQEPPLTPKELLKEEFIENLNSYLSYTGIGQFRISEGNRFYIIELKNPVSVRNSDMFSGFFKSLFSSLSERPLSVKPFSPNNDTLRWYLTTEEGIAEIDDLRKSGASDEKILEVYQNTHLI